MCQTSRPPPPIFPLLSGAVMTVKGWLRRHTLRMEEMLPAWVPEWLSKADHCWPSPSSPWIAKKWRKFSFFKPSALKMCPLTSRQPATSASPGDLLEMQILRPPNLLNQKLWKVGPATVLTSPPGDSHAQASLKSTALNHWIWGEVSVNLP